MKQTILDYVLNDPGGDDLPEFFGEVNIENLALVVEIAEQNLPIEQLERLERVLKQIWINALAGQLTGPEARELATTSKQLGLLRKYKPYAVKAASPLGYSVFLQRPTC